MADDQVSMVKQANDIVEVIGEYLRLQKRGRTYKGLCPFHDDHTPSLDVDPARQRFRCWACGKFGSVFDFIMERERVEFREALEILARRANISLKRTGDSSQAKTRQQMFDLMKWAEERYHQNLVKSAGADDARCYLAERRLSPDTIEKYGLGYAPDSWTWFTREAKKAGWSDELLVQLGLAGARESDGSLYDRFRGRVMFPIRDVRGRTVGFGGRILPSSSAPADAPKYYNSTDTPLFTKSEHLFGLDQARASGEKEGYLAVVEGYTDVLMAHQMGVMPVVATLGTALNVRHIAQLRRFVPRVVLVFDADAGGERGVDQALELFISQDVELAIATLPAGLDPCDLLVQQGPEPFRAALSRAVDALDFKLGQVMTPEASATVEGRRRALETILRILAAAPEVPGTAGALKRDLMITRLAHRCGVGIDVVRQRLVELQRARPRPAERKSEPAPAPEEPRQARPDPAERELLEILLAEPALATRAQKEITPDELQHRGLARLLKELYVIMDEGRTPNEDLVRLRLEDNPRLAEAMLRLLATGQSIPNRPAALEELLSFFRERKRRSQIGELRGRLQSISGQEEQALDLLRQLQEQR